MLREESLPSPDDVNKEIERQSSAGSSVDQTSSSAPSSAVTALNEASQRDVFFSGSVSADPNAVVVSSISEAAVNNIARVAKKVKRKPESGFIWCNEHKSEEELSCIHPIDSASSRSSIGSTDNKDSPLENDKPSAAKKKTCLYHPISPNITKCLADRWFVHHTNNADRPTATTLASASTSTKKNAAVINLVSPQLSKMFYPTPTEHVVNIGMETSSSSIPFAIMSQEQHSATAQPLPAPAPALTEDATNVSEVVANTIQDIAKDLSILITLPSNISDPDGMNKLLEENCLNMSSRELLFQNMIMLYAQGDDSDVDFYVRAAGFQHKPAHKKTYSDLLKKAREQFPA
jgi:hypothetical protein